jgi:hypothetical protein
MGSHSMSSSDGQLRRERRQRNNQPGANRDSIWLQFDHCHGDLSNESYNRDQYHGYTVIAS